MEMLANAIVAKRGDDFFQAETLEKIDFVIFIVII